VASTIVPLAIAIRAFTAAPVARPYSSAL
jgi:hypothetical protein